MKFIFIFLGLAVALWLFLATKKKPKAVIKKRQKTVSQPVASVEQTVLEAPFFLDLKEGRGVAASAFAPVEPKEEALQIFRDNVQQIQPISPIWGEIQQAIEQGLAVGKVAQIVKSDAGLTTEVLKAANSKDFDLEVQINDVGQAIVRLGFHAVRGIVSSYCLASVTGKWRMPFQTGRLWKHAMAVSILASVVAKYIPGCNHGVASTLGLLHDIGRMGLNVITQAQFKREPSSEEGFLAFEHEHFGCNHIDTGVMLAKHWYLPTNIQMGIQFHHHPSFS